MKKMRNIIVMMLCLFMGSSVEAVPEVRPVERKAKPVEVKAKEVRFERKPLYEAREPLRRGERAELPPDLVVEQIKGVSAAESANIMARAATRENAPQLASEARKFFKGDMLVRFRNSVESLLRDIMAQLNRLVARLRDIGQRVDAKKQEIAQKRESGQSTVAAEAEVRQAELIQSQVLQEVGEAVVTAEGLGEVFKGVSDTPQQKEAAERISKTIQQVKTDPLISVEPAAEPPLPIPGEGVPLPPSLVEAPAPIIPSPPPAPPAPPVKPAAERIGLTEDILRKQKRQLREEVPAEAPSSDLPPIPESGAPIQAPTGISLPPSLVEGPAEAPSAVPAAPPAPTIRPVGEQGVRPPTSAELQARLEAGLKRTQVVEEKVEKIKRSEELTKEDQAYIAKMKPIEQGMIPRALATGEGIYRYQGKIYLKDPTPRRGKAAEGLPQEAPAPGVPKAQPRVLAPGEIPPPPPPPPAGAPRVAEPGKAPVKEARQRVERQQPTEISSIEGALQRQFGKIEERVRVPEGEVAAPEGEVAAWE